MAEDAVSYPGYDTRSQTPYRRIDKQKKKSARHEIILVKNHTSFWIVVSLNFVSPDILTRRPMIVLSPVANTTPWQVPCTTKVEVSARLRVSRALSDVASRDPGTISLQLEFSQIQARRTRNKPFTSQERAIKAKVGRCLYDTHVGRDTVASTEHDNITNDNVSSFNYLLLSVPNDRSFMCN
jgi:hypothetical protein